MLVSKGENSGETFSKQQIELVLFMTHKLVRDKIARLLIIVVPHSCSHFGVKNRYYEHRTRVIVIAQ